MLANRRFLSFCYSLVTLCAMSSSPLRASVAYIVNCCNHPSTVSVVDTVSEQQTAQWTVGTVASDTAFSPDATIAYISDTVSESVSVVQVGTGNILATIPVGYQITWMTISSDGQTLYAESYDYAYESHIVAIDTVTNTVSRVAGLSAFLGPMVVTPDGTKLYVNSSFSAQPGLLAIDTLSLTVVATIPLGAANGIAITPDGKFAYVPNLGTGEPYNPSVAVVDIATDTVTTAISLHTNLNPGLTQVSPDGSMVWVSEFPLYSDVKPVVVVISTATNQIVGQVTLLGEAVPGSIVFGPDGKHAWVAAGGAAVDVVDVARLKAISQFTTPGSVGGLAVSPNGKILLVPNSGDSQVAAIGVSHGALQASVPVGAMDWSNSQLFGEYGGAAASPDGSLVYVTNEASSNISIIDTASKTLVKSVNTGGSPVGVAVSPDGLKAYVANSTSNSVTVIDTGTFATTEIPMPKYSYPSSIAITPDGTHVYVAGNNPQPDFRTAACFVFVIDTSSNQVVASIRVPYPMALTASPDGTKVYVVANLTYLYTISTATNTVINKLFVTDAGPEQPVTGGIAVTPDGRHVFLDDGLDNKVFEVDVTQNKVVATIRAGSTPGILAVTPDGSEVWVGDYYATSASVIDIATGTVTKTIPLGSQSYGIAFAAQ